MTTETQTPDTTATIRPENFHFKQVKVTDGKYENVRKSFDLAGVSYTEKKDDNGKLVSIIRNNEKHDLPVIAIDDLLACEGGEAFLADMIHNLVVKAARDNFVDPMTTPETGLATAIDAAMVIAANKSKRVTAVSAEIVADYVKHVNAVMTAKNVKAGTIAVVSELVKGKFSAATLNKNRKHEAAFLALLEAAINYAQELGESDQIRFTPLLELMASNYESWLKAEQEEEEGLELDLL